MLRLSANLGLLWPDRPLLARIEAAARAGFEAVELHWPYDVPATELRAAIDRHGLALVSLNTPVGSLPGDLGLAAQPGREDEFRRAFDDALRYALATGAKAIHVMAGVVAPEDAGRAHATLIANLQRIAPELAEAGLTGLIEPINRRDRPSYFFDDVAHAACVLDEVNAPALTLLFDFYHAHVTEPDPLASFERHSDRIGHVQVAAAISRAEPDEGPLDYRAVFARIATSRYAGWIGCEYNPRGRTDEGLGWRERLPAGEAVSSGGQTDGCRRSPRDSREAHEA